MFSWLSEWMKWLVALVFGAWVLTAASGCRGVAPLMSQANPETSFVAAYDPLSRTWRADFYSNDGRALMADKITAEAGDKKFEAINLKVTERSVENREANVQQIEAGAKQLAEIRGMVSDIASMVGMMSANRGGGGQASPMEEMVKGLIEAEIKKRLPAPAGAVPAPSGEVTDPATETADNP